MKNTDKAIRQLFRALKPYKLHAEEVKRQEEIDHDCHADTGEDGCNHPSHIGVEEMREEN